MRQLELTILAQDILETEYMDNDDCAITRALSRAGRPDLHDSGIAIRNEDGDYIIKQTNEVYQQMAEEVIQMYRRRRGLEQSIDIIDRNYIIEY